ncbi:MAG: M57 family metalloprotease, partial [Acidobacteriota bacterium]
RDDEDIVGWTRDGRPHVEKVRLEAEFIRFIEDTVRGHANLQPYEAAATEVLTPAPARGGGLPLSTNATFAAATYSTQFPACGQTRYGGRWPTAVMNAGIRWFKNDQNHLAGADDGGVSAIRAGLAAWTTDGGSAVNMTYAGTGTELARYDSKNSVVFNDPQNLIAGRWTGSGVIATAHLYGSGAHTFEGDTFVNIVDADIVFQNGYTASELSLEEAMTHEIGHALGLRHSNRHFDLTCPTGAGCDIGCGVPACDPATENCATTSIMNASVINTLGYVLQGWDLRAARALYPIANAAPLAPTNVVALASTSSDVFVSWSGSDGATSYLVWRLENGVYTNLGPPSPPAATSFLDQSSLADRGYIYQVQALNGSGSSPLSVGDIAITVIYTDPTLTAGMQIKAVHLTQLRTAADLMFALTGSTTAPTYTDPTIVIGSTRVKAVHFQEVEAVLRGARGSLGLSVPAALGIAAGSVIPAAHIVALRTYAQ